MKNNGHLFIYLFIFLSLVWHWFKWELGSATLPPTVKLGPAIWKEPQGSGEERNQQLGDKSVLLHLIFYKHILESSLVSLTTETQNNSIIQAFVFSFAFLNQAHCWVKQIKHSFPSGWYWRVCECVFVSISAFVKECCIFEESTQNIFEAGKNRAFVHFHGGSSVFNNRSKLCGIVYQLNQSRLGTHPGLTIYKQFLSYFA